MAKQTARKKTKAQKAAEAAQERERFIDLAKELGADTESPDFDRALRRSVTTRANPKERGRT